MSGPDIGIKYSYAGVYKVIIVYLQIISYYCISSAPYCVLAAGVRVCDWTRSMLKTGSYSVECTLYEFLWINVSNTTFCFMYLYHLFDYQALLRYKYGTFQGCSSYCLFLFVCKTSIFSIGVMECLLSMRCCANLDFPFSYLKSRKFSWNLI